MIEPLYKKIKPILEQAQQRCFFCLPETNLLKCDERTFLCFGLLGAFAESLFGKKRTLELPGAPLYSYLLYELLNLSTEEKITYSFLAMPSVFNHWVLSISTDKKTLYCDPMSLDKKILFKKSELDSFLRETAIRTIRQEESTFLTVKQYEKKMKRAFMERFEEACPPEYSSIQSKVEAHEKDVAFFEKQHEKKMHEMERLMFARKIDLQEVFSVSSDEKKAFQSQLHLFIAGMSLDPTFQTVIEEHLTELNLKDPN